MEESSLTTTRKLYTVANFVGGSVMSAFFGSLERCPCINLTTSDLVDNNCVLMFRSSTRRHDLRHSLPTIVAAPVTVSSNKLPG